MKYWAYFVAKLAVIYVFASVVKRALHAIVPISASVREYGHQPFTHDLGWTSAMMAYSLVCFGLVYLAILDQKFRCRTCLRRLRMPVNSGSWDKALIFAPPRIEYICPFGHGTMKQRELQISGRESADWVEHDDIWKELESLGRRK